MAVRSTASPTSTACRGNESSGNPRLADYVFTGTMDYAPNIDAVVWFVQDILPLIRQTVSGSI